MSEGPSSAHHPAPPPPDSIDELALAQKGKTRKGVFALLGIAVAAAGGAALFARAQTAKANREASAAWGAFERCMLGAGLAQGETPALRFRALQLTASAMSMEARAAEGDKPWPKRCAGYATDLRDALKAAGRAKKDGKDLAAFVDALGKKIQENDAFAADLAAQITEAWQQAGVEGVEAAPGVDVPNPPELAKPLTADALGAKEPLSKTSFQLKSALTEAHPGGAMRVLIQDDAAPASPFLCTFTRASKQATCRALPGSLKGVKHGLRLLATTEEDAEPLVFAGNRGDAGVYRSDTGDLVEKRYSYGGWATSDGYSSVLGWDEEKRAPLLIRKIANSEPDRTLLEPEFRVGNAYYSTQLVFDQVLLRGVDKEQRRRFYAQKVPKTGPFKLAPIDVGELEEAGRIEGGPDEPPHIAACRTKDVLVVRVKGYTQDFMSFLADGTWSAPTSPGFGGGVLSCHGKGAAVTRVEVAGSDKPWKTGFTQAQCSSAGCSKTRVSLEKFLGGMLQFAPREHKVDAVDLDGKLLVVWAAGERGGVRMRLAPPGEIERAKDVIVFDDLVKQGQVDKLSTLFDLRLFSREGFAILLLSTVAGVHAIRVEADGSFAPVELAWKKP